VSHPVTGLKLFKIEPPDFEGFYPATINKDPYSAAAGENLTVAGYGWVMENNGSVIVNMSLPREVYETQVQAGDTEDNRGFFRLRADSFLGPSVGAYSSALGIVCIQTCCTDRLHSSSSLVQWYRRLWHTPSGLIDVYGWYLFRYHRYVGKRSETNDYTETVKSCLTVNYSSGSRD
jgi:hypothetical protein